MSLKTGYILDIILVIITIVSSFTTVLWQDTQQEVESLLIDAQYYMEFADQEAQWLIDSQLENGALPIHPSDNGYVYIIPYFSCHAALALVKYGSVEALESTKEYMQWHFAHLNKDRPDIYNIKNTIYDYTIKLRNGEVISERSSRDYDSADSYAALMLSLLNRYVQATHDIDYANEYYNEFEGIVGVIDDLMFEGLAYTTPAYPVSYLIDNCEVYEGLNDAAILMETIYLPSSKDSAQEYESRNELYNKILALREEVYTNIEDKLWDEESGYYEYALQAGKHYFGYDMDKLYPDAIAQLTPFSSGVIDANGQRAKSLYASFNERYNWQNISEFIEKESTSFYWSSLVHSAAIMGDLESVNQYLEQAKIVMLPGRKYPYNNHESSSILRATIICAEYYYGKADDLDPLYLFHKQK